MKNILQEITRLCSVHGWSKYELAKKTGIPQSTISTWYRKNQIPTIPTLEIVCKSFEITLSQFFAEGNDAILLTSAQKELLDNWSGLNSKQQRFMIDLLKHMSADSS